MIEEHLERMGIVLRDTDDQHVVIIAQKVAVSDAAVDVALDRRADLSYEILCPAGHEDWQLQHVTADYQPENLGGDEARTSVRLLWWQFVAAQHMTDNFEREEFTD
jgi:hypothetical protein